jgi:hypothetical protein
VDKAALGLLGWGVMEENDEGKRRVRGPTAFFMPHCPMRLYSNLLWANWGDGLKDLVIIGNR